MKAEQPKKQHLLGADEGLEACRNGDLKTLRALLNPHTSQKRWNVETQDRFGSTGLHWAASGGFLNVCKYIVEQGANPLHKDRKSGRSALHWASRQVRV